MSEVDLDRLAIEEYLSESIHESPRKLLLRNLLDIASTLTEVAGGIVDKRKFRFVFQQRIAKPMLPSNYKHHRLQHWG